MLLYNTLSRKLEEVKPLKGNEILLYTCGITAYDYTHIGHLRKYVGDDILLRTLEYFGYSVRHFRNYTDVGHLTSDGDEGDDKLEKGAAKQGKTVWEVAEFFIAYFDESMAKMNVLPPNSVSDVKKYRATENIDSMIALVKKLEEKGYTYDTPEAVYFDVSKFAGYGKLSGQRLADKLVGVRSEVVTENNKRHPADFALWFKRIGKFAEHTMHWPDEKLGDGFPGWHVECSAMAFAYLGEQIDIHTGGIDHIPVHHENEIAQSEAASGKEFSRIWMHHNFLQVEGVKMSKSLENFYSIDDIEKRGFDPMALRLLFLQSHYRSEMNFTWEALEAAQNAYKKLKSKIQVLTKDSLGSADLQLSSADSLPEFETEFNSALANDLNTAKALSVLFTLVDADQLAKPKLERIKQFDKVLGLQLLKVDDIPQEIQLKVDAIEKARAAKNWVESDRLKAEIRSLGYQITDTNNETIITKT